MKIIRNIYINEDYRRILKVTVRYANNTFTMKADNGVGTKIFRGTPEEFTEFLRKIQAKDDKVEPRSKRKLTYKEITDEIVNGFDSTIYIWSNIFNNVVGNRLVVKNQERFDNFTEKNLLRYFKDSKYKDYALVLRYSKDPENDINRNWSGYMGSWKNTEQEAYDFVFDTLPLNKEVLNKLKWFLKNNDKESDYFYDTKDLDLDDYESIWNNLSDNDKNEFMQEELDIDIRKDKKTGKWARIHHEGLSCFLVDFLYSFESLDELSNSIEKESKKVRWEGFAEKTEGKVIYIGHTNIRDLYVFICENVSEEN